MDSTKRQPWPAGHTGTRLAKDLVPGDKVGNFVVCRQAEPSGTKGHLWWRKDRVRVEGIFISIAPWRDVRHWDADEVVELNPND